MNPHLENDPLIARLLALRLPGADYAVFGSGPLLAHGLKQTVHDLDVVARGAAWEKAKQLGKPRTAPSGSGEMVELAGGSLQVFNAWTSAEWDVDQLIDKAEIVDGIRFVALADVLAWKRQSNRRKDVADIKLIEAYLGL